MDNTVITIHWDDLDDHFSEEKDIIQVAEGFSLLDAKAVFDAGNFLEVRRLLDEGKLLEISDETLNAWFDNNQQLHATETAEWILLQLPV